MKSTRHSIPFLFVAFTMAAVLQVSYAYGEGPSTPKSNAMSTKAEDHWSFQPLSRPQLPVVANAKWSRNPIDHFILAECEQHSILPSPEANREILIRRIYLDVIGLPPTPQEVALFLADPRPNAYEVLVDKLLGSHHFGIKRGQHWLDLARFAETDGFEHDKTRNDAWKYRDWVIDAVNADVPFDRFVRLQLAGDEMKNESKSIATAFCLSGPDMPDINSQEERRQNVLNEVTGTIGSTILGLQLGCAQCHDHKFDPITQKDFYSLRAIFEPAVIVKKNQSLSVLREAGKKAPESFLMIRGDWQRKGEKVSADVPEVLKQGFVYQPTTRSNSTGRRTALADWVTHKDNPLTARVIVNRIWQYHFGNGFVSTPNDFGLMGETPTHPELLDWLATELIEQEWSLKHLSRLILTSATYRQAGALAGRNDVHDPKLLACFPRQRLSGEVIRDSMLAASRSIDFSMGGQGVMPPIPEELSRTLLKNQWQTSKTTSDHFRRSIFVFARRNLRYPLFEVFDRPDGNQSCPRRSRSVTAPQSLHLLNSELSLNLSRRLAGDVLSASSDLSNAIGEVFRRTLCRSPKPNELRILISFVENQAEEIRRTGNKTPQPIPNPPQIDEATGTAMTYLCLAIFNTNEFIYID